MSYPLYVIGSGGHSKVVVSTLLEAGIVPSGILDQDPSRVGQRVLGIEVLGDLRIISGDAKPIRLVAAVGDNATRMRIASEVSSIAPSVEWVRVIHPRAYVHPSAEIGEGTVVFAGAVVQPEARIGRHCIINTAATVDHDCRIGDFCHLAPGCHLAGNVRIGTGSFMGVGSSIIPGRLIGDWSVVGAGSTVIRDVPSCTVYAGCPARPLKPKG